MIGQFERLPSFITSTSSGPTWGIQIVVTDNRTLKLLMCIPMLVLDSKFLFYYWSVSLSYYSYYYYYFTNYLFGLTDKPELFKIPSNAKWGQLEPPIVDQFIDSSNNWPVIFFALIENNKREMWFSGVFGVCVRQTKHCSSESLF